MTKIIGIFLVRNEDRFVEQAIRNVMEFCDQILLVDHGSSDGTVEILRSFQESDSQKFSLHQITHPRESHELLKQFAGTSTWVFGVDGDEIYDPERLRGFRLRLFSVEFNSYWMILGNVLHVDQLDQKKETASGYLAPPSRSITKLYNFSAIASWNGNTLERLHGGDPQFREGFHGQKKRLLQDEYGWNDAPLRCLHLCFIPRSSNYLSKVRKNIMETYSGGKIKGMRRFFRSFLNKFFGVSDVSSWKQQHYARGEYQTIDATPFF